MKIALVSPYADISSLGVRSLSACLKQAGHEVILIFLPILQEAFLRNTISLSYNARALDQVVQLCEDVDIIGLSVMTNYFHRAVQLTSHLKSRLEIPIIWGGVHPTAKPEQCLKYADIVCLGEAEQTILELVDRAYGENDIAKLKGVWLKENGQIIKNPVRALNSELDTLPFPDYDLEGHYALYETSIQPMTSQLFAHFLAQHALPGIKDIPCYQTITARGCPYSCSYCCNHMYQTIYRGQSYLRRRSTDHLIRELKWAKDRFDFIGAIQFSDDTLFATGEDIIADFAEKYKEQINLPFYCLGHPETITEKKMRHLVDAGLKCIQIGVETASEKTRKIFRRKVTNERVLETVETVHRFTDRIYPPIYDFIVDNPYETQQDLLETIRFILRFPKPYELNLFALVLFPGTELYEQALKDGYICAEQEEKTYQKAWIDRQKNYTNLLFSLLGKGCMPKSVLTFLSHPKLVELLTHKGARFIEVIFDLRRIVAEFRAK